jgi:hypothetical protein
VDVGENVGRAVACIDLRNCLHRTHPARRFRRYVDSILVIFLDAHDRFAQRTMQRRIVRQVLAHAVADAFELPLDDALLRLAARCQQHIAIACCQAQFGMHHRMSSQSQAARDRTRRRTNCLMSRVACEK